MQLVDYHGVNYTKFKTVDNRIRRGIAFAGCSFTWGQGLYYYSNLPTIQEPMPNHFDRWLVRSAHVSYMESIRYPRLVATHFNTFEEVHPYNGGSDESIIDFWTRTFDPRRDKIRHMNDDGVYSVSDPNYNYNEFAYFVYQFTQPERTRTEFMYQGKKYHFNVHYAIHRAPDNPNFEEMDRNMEVFGHWLLEQGMTYEQWEIQHRISVMNQVKTMLQNFENHGVRTKVIVWPHNMTETIDNDPWMKERRVMLKYKGEEHPNIDSLFRYPEMKIDTDNYYFKVTPGDHHPSLMCHQVIANSLIDSMDRAHIYRP